MKALLCERPRHSEGKPVIVLLPSGKKQPETGDPANLAVELNKGRMRVWVIMADELESLKMFKEVSVNDVLYFNIMKYYRVQVKYVRMELKLKKRLDEEMVASRCDIFTFLAFGPSVVL